MMKRILTWLGLGSATLVDDSGVIQTIQITQFASGQGIGDRITDNVRHYGEYGLISVPPIGSDAIVGYLNGDRTKPMVLAIVHVPSRPKGYKPGDSGLHNGITNAIITQTDEGTEVDCGGLPLIFKNYSSASFTGDVLVETGGTLISVKALHDAYNSHTHEVTAVGSPTATTSEPV